MNKFIYILLFLTSFCFGQKDSLSVQEINYDNSTLNPKTIDPTFKDKYLANEFQYEVKVDDSKLSAWNRFWKNVGDFFSNLFDIRDADRTTSTLGVIMKIIAFLIIGFVIFMIVKIIINKEGGWVFGKSATKINVANLVEENIHNVDFKKLVSSSKNDKEYRTTIRYYYLWLENMLNIFSTFNCRGFVLLC